MREYWKTISPEWRGNILVFAGAFLISFAAFFVKGAAMDPSVIAFYRLLFGSIALMLITAARRERLSPAGPTLRFVMLSGALFCCDLLLWHESIVLIGPGIATIVANFEVLFLAIYGVIFLGEKLTWPQKLAMPLALAGLSLLLDIHRNALPPYIVKGVMLSIISAMFYAAYILSVRKTQSMEGQLAPVPNMAWVSTFAFMCVGLFCLGTGKSFVIPDVKTLSILAGLGIVCQSFGWLLLSQGLPLLSPFRAGLIMLTQPALSYLWDLLFYGGASGLTNIVGAVIAIAAIGMGIFTQREKAQKT